MKPELKRAITNAVDCLAKDKVGIALGCIKKYFRFNSPGDNEEALKAILAAVQTALPDSAESFTQSIRTAATAGTVDYFENNRSGRVNAGSNAAKAGAHRNLLKTAIEPGRFTKGQLVESRLSKQRGTIVACLNEKYPERILKTGRIWVVQTSRGRVFVNDRDLVAIPAALPRLP
jgi:hypothetical protein